MDGKLNCSMTAENAAFTKIRHLDNRITDAETRLDVLEQETTQLDEVLQNAIEGLQEKVETENVDTTTLNADTVEATHIEADSITTPELTATTIEAESIAVDNLENVNVLHGKTVDVEKTIATIGQFTETQTTTANNGTTNTTELNVNGETNLIGQVNIDGNMTFTKDNGLSKLQGNYLEIDAANVVIDNKNDAEYALYVPGINGDALFGGSVAVQDTLAAKNLIVTNETFIKNLKLDEGTVLNNPILENIAQTQELTDRALDIDENGKLVRKFVAGGSAGSVASSLIANETRYTYGLLDKYKPTEESSNYHVVLSDTASYTFNVSGQAKAYLENSNGQRYEFENSNMFVGMYLTLLSITHKNIFYAIIPTFDADMENVVSAEIRKINLNNMQVEYAINVSEYFAGSMSDLASLVTWLPSQNGNILSEDKPVLAIAGTNKYFDLATGTLSTRDENFTGSNTYYLSKTNTWYELAGSLTSDSCWATNNKYSSIEDAAEIDAPYLENGSYIFDAPVFCINDGTLKWLNNGAVNEFEYGSTTLNYRDENNNKVLFAPCSLYFNGTEYETNLYNQYCYVVNEYVSETPYQVEKVKIDRTEADFTDIPITAETITINDKATIEDIETSTIDAEAVKTIDAEIDGMKFYKGKWYDKIVGTTRELINYVLDTTNKDAIKIYSILFTGDKIHFDASVLPEEAIQADQVIGTYKVYHDTEDNTKELSFLDNNYEPYGEYEPLAYFKELLDKVHFYGFKTELDVISNEGLAAEYSKCLHINNCYFNYSENYYTNTVASRLILKNCNNVEIGSNLKWNSTAILNLEQCNGIYATNFGMGKSDATNVEILMVHSNNCCVEIPSAVVGTVTYTQAGPGDNLVVHYQVADDGTKIDPTYTKYW